MHTFLVFHEVTLFLTVEFQPSGKLLPPSHDTISELQASILLLDEHHFHMTIVILQLFYHSFVSWLLLLCFDDATCLIIILCFRDNSSLQQMQNNFPAMARLEIPNIFGQE